MPKELRLSPSASRLIDPLAVSGLRSTTAGGHRRHPRGNSLDEGPAAALEQTLDGVRFSSWVSAQHVIDPFPVKDWDRYELVKLLGRGGMGAVYLARDRRLGRPVAPKFCARRPAPDRPLRPRSPRPVATQPPQYLQGLRDRRIEGKAYIAMEYIDGQSLDRVGKRLPLLEKVQLLRDVAQALHSAHELGIIHRDIKPANIMLTSPSSATSSGAVGPRAVLMDFGLARESGTRRG